MARRQPVVVVAITFETQAQNDAPPRFSIPKAVCRLLKVKSGDFVDLRVRSGKATVALPRQRLLSGTEVYGKRLKGVVTPGERLLVTVRPVTKIFPS